MINLLVSTQKEFLTIQQLLNHCVGQIHKPFLECFSGYYNNKELTIYQIGIGKTNSCKSLHFISDIEGEMINVGTCCSLTRNLEIGQPVQVISCCQWDFDVLEGVGILKSNYLPRPKYQSLGSCTSPFKKVDCATGDSFITSEKVDKILKEFPPMHIADMEVAAINDFFNGIRPIKSFKVVSDYANIDQFINCWDKVEEGFKQILDFLTKDNNENN